MTLYRHDKFYDEDGERPMTQAQRHHEGLCDPPYCPYCKAEEES